LSCFAALLNILFCTSVKAEEQPGATDASEQTASSTAPVTAVSDPDDPWHVGAALYLWLPGVHGTTGLDGHDVGFRASAGDLLSHFRFGLMITPVAQRGRFVLLSDLVWVRLEANKQRALPFPGLPELSAQLKAQELIANPEFGYRVLDGEKIKMDALLGVRYWHLGSSLQFTPSLVGGTLSASQNWADPLMGARIQAPLAPRVLVSIRGDAGGWGAGAQLDYQLVGSLEFKLNPKFSIGAAYRYLYVDYYTDRFLYRTAMSGPVVGVVYNFK
jgi:hypothetical protein